MSCDLLDKLAGPLGDVQPTDVGVPKSFKYGIKARVDFTIRADHEDKFTRPTAVFTNVMTPYGRLNIQPIEDMEVTDGYNSRVIDDSGMVNEQMVYDNMRSSGMVKNQFAYEVAMNCVTHANENCVGVIFNLIRLYLIKSSDLKKLKVEQGDVFYNDGHVAQSYRDYLGYSFDGPPTLVPNEGIVEQHNELHPIQGGDFYPEIQSMSDEQVRVLMLATFGWESSAPVRIMSSCKPLTRRFLVRDGLKFHLTTPNLEDFNATEVLVTIKKFVTDNRLETQFDLAYFLVCQALYSPMPRAVEANAWVRPNLDFYIPKAATARGAYRGFLTGQPLCSRPATMNTWPTFLSNTARVHVHAVALTEALYAGLFEVLTRRTGHYLDSIAEFGLDGAAAHSRTKLVLECASYRFGAKFTFPWYTSCGGDFLRPITRVVSEREAKIEVSPVGQTYGYEIASEVTPEGNRYFVRSLEAKPILFPVLSYGINDDRYYLNSLSYSATGVVNELGTGMLINGCHQASRMLAALRLGGYDSNVLESCSGKSYKNWAANANGHFMSIPPTVFGEHSSYVLRLDQTTRRKMCWINWPHVTARKVEVSVDIKQTGFVMFRDGEQRLVNVKLYKPVSYDMRRYRDESFIAVQMTTHDGRTPYRYSDFLFRQINTSEESTEAVLVSSAIQGSQFIETSPEQDSVRQQEVLDPEMEA